MSTDPGRIRRSEPRVQAAPSPSGPPRRGPALRLVSGRGREPLLDAERERMLIADGGERALGELIAWHMPLVRATAARYACRGVAFEDLVSEGTLGLVEAAHRFDPGRAARFGTYAAFWVRAFVRRFARSNQRLVQAPSTRLARRLQSAVPRTRRRLEQEQGAEASSYDVARALGVSPDDLAMVELPPEIAVNTAADVGGHQLSSPEPSPEEGAAAAEERRLRSSSLRDALAGLSERERDIVRRRYLVDDRETLARLGKAYGLSRERVRQVERRACDKLRGVLTVVLECEDGGNSGCPCIRLVVPSASVGLEESA